MRILLSGPAAADIGPRIAPVFGSRPFEIVTSPAGLSVDFDIAFVTRDVTGRSTKLELEPPTRAFHDGLRQAKSLRWVHIHAAGADRPIYVELQARGVKVTTSSGANAAVVAHSALAGILALARRFPLLMAQQRAREWKSLIAEQPRDLEGQVAVIVGWGPIAQRLAGWLRELGLGVVVVRNSAQLAEGYETRTYDQLRDVAPRADWLVIACPLSDRTHRLVGRDVLSALPAGAHVVNVGRGEVIVEAHLIEALQQGHLGGAFLDVFEHEPLSPDSPLWDMPNVILTPHCAGMSDGNGARVAQMFLDNLGRFLEGSLA